MYFDRATSFLSSSQPQSSGSLAQAVTSLTSLTGSLRSEVVARRLQDNLIFARLKEEQDYSFNKNREDRFTVTGVQVSVAPPRDPIERKAFFKNLLSGLVAEACPELTPTPEVLDVYVNMRYGRGPPFLEARLNSAEASSAFRVAAAKLAKDESPNFRVLFVANAVTLTTRVRIEILKALAKRLTTKNEEAYVQSFSSRPMLHYQSRGHALHPAPGTNRSYSFVEAVGRWGDRLTTVELLPAYRRARPAFIGCLEQYFVVLKESEPREDATSGFDQLFGSRPRASPSAATWSRGGRERGARQSFRAFRGSRQSGFGQSSLLSESNRTDPSGLPLGRKRTASNDCLSTPSKKKENESAAIGNLNEETGME